MKHINILFSILLFSVLASAQSRNCPTTVNLNSMKSQDPARYQRYMDLENFTSRFASGIGNAGERLSDLNGVITIPVVVHVLHQGEAVGTGRNISVAQIQSQIDVLNEDFRRLNADRTNTPAAFAGVASDPGFEFRLACQDPSGNATTGILRRQTTRASYTVGNPINETTTGIKMTAIAGEDPWPTSRYLNIWVCTLNGGILGYATFPADFAANPNVDGVVINTTSMGRVDNVVAPFHRGRTATHEIGHWLNLRHIWGDANCGDDQVGDTPTQQTSNFGCPAFPRRTCGNTTNGDMFMNYMDYTDDLCMNVYSAGQRTRARAVFAAGGPRAAFIDNYFRIQTPAATVGCTSGTVTLTNTTCLAPTWSVVSGGATIVSGQGTNACTFSTFSLGAVTIRATAGNYISEITVNNGVTIISTTNGCVGGYQQWFLNATPSTAGSNWNWSVNFLGTNSQITISSPSSPSTWVSVKGGGTVRLNYTDVCGAARQDGLTVYSGCPPFRIAASPNPASGSINLAILPADEKNSSSTDVTGIVPLRIKASKGQTIISLFDANTSKIARQWKNTETKTMNYKLNITGLTKGIYILQVDRDGESKMTKIIVE
jgi:Pregnancy-associated plasma protein-A/Secretion system C-terminal sorting domain